MAKKNKLVAQDVDETPREPTTSSVPAAPSLDDVLAAVVGDVPQPSPIADMPQPPAAQNPQPAPATGGKRGRPALTPEQKAQRKADRASGAFIKRETTKPTLNGIPHITPSPMPGQEGIEPCAQVATSMIAFSGVALGGEAATMLPAEQLLVKDGFVAYFRAKGVNNVPPWVILAGALTPYYMRVFTQTPAKSKLALFAEKASFGVKHLFGKLRNARANRRNDNERQNDSSEATGESGKE